MRIQYNNDINDILIAVKHIMIDKNIKNKDICEYSGLSKQTISNLLNGRNTNITLDTLKTLCDALGCKLYIDIE